MAADTYHIYRVLSLLMKNGGALGRWEITQKCLTNVTPKERAEVYFSLRENGYVTSCRGRKMRNGKPVVARGKFQELFQLTAKGKEAAREISKQAVVVAG